ncbi:MAG: ATP-binding protein [Pseudobdellovibrionaceae bacterium]
MDFLTLSGKKSMQPVKILKGPRQVGKTTLLTSLPGYKLISLDDLSIRNLASENPKQFLDQFQGPLILDEVTYAPQLFPEIKLRVDQYKLNRLNQNSTKSIAMEIDYWLTGSNQTLLTDSVGESLAGRSSYFDLNTLSISEIKSDHLPTLMMQGGWPELYSNPDVQYVSYLNDFIATFIEKDIVAASGIKQTAAFSKVLQLISGRIGQLMNFSDIAQNVGVESTTVQNWTHRFEQNGLLRVVQPYFTNLNQRLIKSPKIYFEDVGLAIRMQGWRDYEPFYLSPSFGHLVENLALIQFVRYFQNCGEKIEVHFVRSKEKVEVDFLISLSNQKWLAVEVKSSPQDWTEKQLSLSQSLHLDIVERWTVCPQHTNIGLKNSRLISIFQIEEELRRLLS